LGPAERSGRWVLWCCCQEPREGRQNIRDGGKETRPRRRRAASTGPAEAETRASPGKSNSIHLIIK